jgi:hypothetical protein
LAVAYILAGLLDRSGPGAGYADVTPSADQMLAALPDLVRGDSFTFQIRDSAGFANTIVAGAGITLAGTTAVAASNTREYLMTLLSDNRARASVLVALPTLTRCLPTSPMLICSNIGIGMLVTGTGVGASAVVTAINLTLGTVTVTVNSTATADNIALTFTPNFEMRGLGTRAN